MDSRDGSSYLSAPLISELNREPNRREYKRIEMMMTSTTQKIEMYKVQTLQHYRSFHFGHYPEESIQGNFANYPKPGVHVITKYKLLKGVEIHDTNIKTNLPTDLTLQSSK